MTMTFGEFHKGVRDALHGSGLSKFVCNVESVEAHPGRLRVEWRLSIVEIAPPIYLHGPNPYALLAMLKHRIAGIRQAKTLPPPSDRADLADVCEPPEVA